MLEGWAHSTFLHRLGRWSGALIFLSPFVIAVRGNNVALHLYALVTGVWPRYLGLGFHCRLMRAAQVWACSPHARGAAEAHQEAVGLSGEVGVHRHGS